jgi:hypothetical protein
MSEPTPLFNSRDQTWNVTAQTITTPTTGTGKPTKDKNSIAIGFFAGASNQQAESVAIGSSAGQYSQNAGSVLKIDYK